MSNEVFERFIELFLNNPFRNINERIDRGRTVLHYAAQISDVGIIKLVIEEGATVNARDERGETPLHLAAFLGKTENVKALIEKGAEVNAKSNNEAVPLHLACLARRVKTIEVLINAGRNMKAIDRFECSPLNYAKIYPKVTRYLERRGVSMIDVPPMYEKANEAVEEIMDRRKAETLVKKVLLEEAMEEEIKEP